MDPQYIDGQHIMARYLANQLSEAEQAAFEESLRNDPALLQELGAAADFKLGLQALQEDGQLAAAMTRPDRRTYLILAAAMAMLAVMVFVVVQDWRSDPPASLLVAARQAVVDARGQPLPEGRTFEISHARTAQDATTIELLPAASVTVLQVLLDAPDVTTRYGMRLTRVSSEGKVLADVGQLDGLQPDADGFLTAFVSSTTLIRGSYELTVRPEAGAPAVGADSVYLINVVSAAIAP